MVLELEELFDLMYIRIRLVQDRFRVLKSAWSLWESFNIALTKKEYLTVKT